MVSLQSRALNGCRLNDLQIVCDLLLLQNFLGFYFSLLTAITVVLGGENSDCTQLKLGPPFSRMVSSSLNGKLLGGGPTEVVVLVSKSLDPYKCLTIRITSVFDSFWYRNF